ncbi:MAG: CRISPR-associated helicase Cas3' [Kyrpidia tusciae]|nr:CRISPR-associated helicase Cas3' [Kyrpidia tusciae]MBE3552788.1 CRISPR-associated helicase Cas3' [Kyrpidia tusciae]
MADAEAFSELFGQTVGCRPFPYQVRLALDAHIPGLIRVPTGLGKTAAVVLSWLWKRRYAAPEIRRSCPRRLVYCLPLRTLVNQVADDVLGWFNKLGIPVFGHPGDEAVQSEVFEPAGTEPIGVHILMGGRVDRDWVRYPEFDQILIGTQDQLLSRALNRGYGVSRGRWPMEFALLHNDVWWVYDEVQLMGGGGIYTTAQLESFRREFGTYGPAYSTWMSATLDPEWLDTVDFAPRRPEVHVLELDERDLVHPVVRERRSAKKRLHWTDFAVSASTATRPKEYAEGLARLALEQHREGSLTLVVLNRVNRAQEVYRQLLAMGADAPVRLVHSRFRPEDRQEIWESIPEIESSGGILVATQAVEAGVDLSARTLITELAPWASLVQRFGRCNRRGEFDGQKDGAGVWIIDLEDEPRCVQPYAQDEIAQARKRLQELTDVGPASLPTWAMSRPDGQVLRRRDLLDLFDTTPDLAGLDLDVSPYVRDVSDTDVQVYWRNVGAAPSTIDWPARRDEICSVSLSAMREYLVAKKDNRTRRDRVWTWDWLTGTWTNFQEKNPVPGRVFLLDAALGGYRPDIGFDPGSWEPVPVIPVADESGSRSRATVAGGEELSDTDDPNSYPGSFVLLTDHLKHVREAAERLVDHFGATVPSKLLSAVVEAAGWHDVGKAHPVFQERLLAGLPATDPARRSLWAKSGQPPRTGTEASEPQAGGQVRRVEPPGDGEGQQDRQSEPSRRHFRHELASALSYLQFHDPERPDGLRDLAAYLIAAHHGKIRMSIRSLPDEVPPPVDPNQRWLFARGVWDGDALPSVTLGDGTVLPPTPLRLGWMLLGRGPWGESWLHRAMGLLNEYGPFRLAFLEMLLRVADWRGSEAEVHVS